MGKRYFQASVKACLNSTKSDIEIVRDSKPELVITLCKTCDVCKVMEHFFCVIHKNDCIVHKEYDNADHHVIEHLSDWYEDGVAWIDLNLEPPKKSAVKKVISKEAKPLTRAPKTDKEKLETSVLRKLKKRFEVEDKFKPHPHQQDLLDRFKTSELWEKTDRFLLFWNMGAGKTKGTMSLFSEHHHEEVFIVCSNTLIGQWEADILSMPQRTGSTTFRIMGYTQFSKLAYEDEDIVRDKVVVLDEAHHYKNVTSNMIGDLEALAKAKNCFLLTGTPLSNDVDDVFGVAKIYDPSIESAEQVTVPVLRRLMQGKVSYYDPKVHNARMLSENYPTVKYVTKFVPMNWDQTLEYVLNQKKDFEFGGYTVVRSKGNAYNAQSRLLSNAICDNCLDAPKAVAIVQDITSKPSGNHVVYSHFLERGINPVKNRLKKEAPKMSYETLDGSTETGKRKLIIDKYNKGQTRVQLLTDAAREGVDLHNTTNFYLMESCQNKESESQAIGRVIRFDSHKKSENKTVTVTKYISVFPKTIDDRTAKKLEAQFRKAYGLEDAEFNFKAELLRKVKEAGMTIDEKIEKNNEEKYKRIQPYLDVLRTVGAPRWDFTQDTAPTPSAPSTKKLECSTKKTASSKTPKTKKDQSSVDAKTAKKVPAKQTSTKKKRNAESSKSPVAKKPRTKQ